MIRPVTDHKKCGNHEGQSDGRTFQPVRPCRQSKPSIYRSLVHNKFRWGIAIVWGTVASCVVATIETIINQNNLQGLQELRSTSQLIPVTVGILQFCAVTYTLRLRAMVSIQLPFSGVANEP